ncbi:DUF2075 domain-containing protein [Aeromicrobium massiliense]|uniref:DUF2075 domain-containing protein n=1 Tax=Aeromicrobium massiliense TaxID=1464554 RepID=UPI001C529537|nr:DUF2075 domain-containing protein [Aeromicrobium massiliense]
MVYTLDSDRRVYVGESTQALSRMRQHLANPDRSHLSRVRIVVDETFNKSVCLDLESFLIRMFSGDGKLQVDNANAGLTGSDYYERDRYREKFEAIFADLRREGLFVQSIEQIENSALFKMSPYKALTVDQRTAVMQMIESLFADLRSGLSSTAVVKGQPGTGKTVVGIYLMKVLADIKNRVQIEEGSSDSILAGFFTEENAELLSDFRMGLVVPQQSLRKTVEKVFAKTSGLHRDMVLSPAKAVEAGATYDLLIVDEAHRLQQLSATMATMINQFKDINRRLFGDEKGGNQVDWIQRASKHQIFLLDPEQTVRPASDISPAVVRGLVETAQEQERYFELTTQMRVRADEDYVGYVRAVLAQRQDAPVGFAEYDLRMYDDLGDMRRAIQAREKEHKLARLVAGYAWPWLSKNDPGVFDIEIDGVKLHWNRTATDWINSKTSADEVGSIHTTQGYDLNYAGVIIGPDLRMDPASGRMSVDRDSYFDTKGKANNNMLGVAYSDDDLLGYIANIYAVLLTRGIRGTYVYVCDPTLREYLSKFIPLHGGRIDERPDLAFPETAALAIDLSSRGGVATNQPSS